MGQSTWAGETLVTKEEMTVIFATLREQIVKCELSLQDKEKDIAHLKFNLQDTRKEFDLKLADNGRLVEENKRIREELELLKTQHQQARHKDFDVKMENITLKNILLEQKVDTVKDQ